MPSHDDPGEARISDGQSKWLPGPPFLRNYPAHNLTAWQPHGTLDDAMLDEIAEWLVKMERAVPPFKRYIDFSKLTQIAIRTRHVFDVAIRRAEEFHGVKPVRTALFSDNWVGYGIACLYETLMANTPIEARAFRDLAGAAEWVGVPIDILK